MQTCLGVVHLIQWSKPQLKLTQAFVVQMLKLPKRNFDQASRFQLLTKSLPFEFFCTDPVQCSEVGDQERNEEMERLTLSVGRTVISIYFKAAECQGGDEVELYIM